MKCDNCGDKNGHHSVKNEYGETIMLCSECKKNLDEMYEQSLVEEELSYD
jgi:uncharacterized Zn finger protein